MENKNEVKTMKWIASINVHEGQALYYFASESGIIYLAMLFQLYQGVLYFYFKVSCQEWPRGKGEQYPAIV